MVNAANETVREIELSPEVFGAKRNSHLVYEAVNFMDGNRTSAEIAESLACEFELPIDAAWVDRLVGVLAKLRLVSRP